MKIALVSPGLGRVLRGFESFTQSLFYAIRNEAPQIDIVLFQGGATSEKSCVTVPNFHRYDAPARWLSDQRAVLFEQRSFALALYPILRCGGYDIVHYNELSMGSALFHLRRHFGGNFKLLYCNGAPSPPSHYHHRCDFAQMLTEPMYRDAIEFGLPENRLFFIPYGVDARRFSPEVHSHRADVRRELGIPHDAKVVLTVAALKREHKRIDYVIKEVSGLDRSIWLLAAGQRTDETKLLEQEAERSLSGRWRFVSWPHHKIPMLYGAADAFVLASLEEAFGLVIVEAMMSGLPVVVHNAPVFRWLVDGAFVRVVDMSTDGALSNCLTELLSISDYSSSRDEAVRRFSWEALVPEYLRMYEDILKVTEGIV